jgi:hypothetical protein
MKFGETLPIFNSNRFNKNRYEKLVGTPYVPENKELSNSSIFTEIALEPAPEPAPEVLEIIKGLEEIGMLEPAPLEEEIGKLELLAPAPLEEEIQEDPKIIVIYEDLPNIDLEVEEIENQNNM